MTNVPFTPEASGMAQGLQDLKVDTRDQQLWKKPWALAAGGKKGILNAQIDTGNLWFCFVCFIFLSSSPHHMGSAMLAANRDI